jgi:hypothetical protein
MGTSVRSVSSVCKRITSDWIFFFRLQCEQSASGLKYFNEFSLTVCGENLAGSVVKCSTCTAEDAGVL